MAKQVHPQIVPFVNIRVGDIVRIKFKHDVDCEKTNGQSSAFLAEVIAVKDLPCEMSGYGVADNMVISFRRLHDDMPNKRRIAREQTIGITEIEPYESCSTCWIRKIVSRGPEPTEPAKPVNIYFEKRSASSGVISKQIMSLAAEALAGLSIEVRRPLSYRRLRSEWQRAGYPGRVTPHQGRKRDVTVEWTAFASWVKENVPMILMTVDEYEVWKANFNRHGAIRELHDYHRDMEHLDGYLNRH
jgi:hypothetical protein